MERADLCEGHGVGCARSRKSTAALGTAVLSFERIFLFSENGVEAEELFARKLALIEFKEQLACRGPGAEVGGFFHGEL
jgi:hypothetical protein